ncbi:hypothetical protein TrLO_g12498 [Triparma laevis f. longispina]|uniref:Major facilitator superfamily (MFS) profile domain-containing protein n=1 Tax=Triparma laevis f. longispina TaxID=1714387 RepID=A0A9W7FSV7_9STRA|nr:hypothetical protein TrLO_g12498 [Triparma laevis f. longispina]
MNTSLPLSNRFLFTYFTLINFLNFLDRGIIPGASSQFNAFITSNLETNSPDVYLGLLQSAFVAGYSVSILYSAHLLHSNRFTTLLTVSLCIWLISILGSGLSGEKILGGSYWSLLFFRCLSGVAEASFQCIIPPLIQDRCADVYKLQLKDQQPHLSSLDEESSFSVSTNNGAKTQPKDATATWLSIYFTAIPCGTAVGYIFGSVMAESSLGWTWAFYLEGMAMVPLVLFTVVLRWSEKRREELREPKKKYLEIESDKLLAPLLQNQNNPPPTSSPRRVSRLIDPSTLHLRPTMLTELKSCLSSLPFVSIILAYAAYTAVLISISTFGSAFVLALGFYDEETTASLVFGGIVSVAGIVGTPLGAVIINSIQYSEEECKEGEDGEPHDLLKVAKSMKLLNIAQFTGILFLSPMVFATSSILFLSSMFFGCIALFVATAFFNLNAMLSVPRQHRSFAVGLLTFGLHALGDVPAPVVVGYMKDSLAPACDINSKGKFDDLQECRDQATGIRITLGVTFSWLIFVLVYVELTRRR